MSEAKEPIKIYLDDAKEPFKIDHPPLRFALSTLPLSDGAHVLRVEASNGLAPPTTKEIPFRVRNGVAVTVSGLEPNQTIGGQVELIVNAYAGNTEVDFEPRRAETPQPVPTWAWVLSLGVLAWALFYLMNPVRPERVAAATTFDVGRELGERLYMDTCARCHGEGGRGLRSASNHDDFLVKRLRETPKLALAETPYKLLFKIVTGTKASGDIQMPAWGPRMTNEELVAVVNFVRSSWGHDASQIEPKYRRPPPGIERLEQDIEDAMVAKNVEAMSFCCWPDRVRPQLYRIDGPRWALGREDVVGEWQGYFEALGDGKVVEFELTDRRYDYVPGTVEDVGSYVFSMGRIFLSTKTAEGKDESDTGRYIRVYRRVKNGKTNHDGTPGSQWALLFDFASIRMRVGCEVEEPDCEPGQEPGSQSGGTDPDGTDPDGTDPDGTDPDGSDPDGTDPDGSDPAGRAGVFYADIQAIFAGLGKDTGDAPHEKFWEIPYTDFIELEFPYSWDDVDDTIKLIEVGSSATSNLIKALKDGKGLKVKLADGTFETRDIARMPKGAPAMPAAQIAIIAAWIDAGCPERAGGTAAKPPAKDEPGKDEPAKDEPKKAEPKGDAPKQSASVGVSKDGYAEIQGLFAALGKDAGDAPHEKFWSLTHKEFCALQFPLSWDEVDSLITMITPYDGAGSNLVKALLDGRGITYTDDSGKERRTDIKRMPKGGGAMDPAAVARIVAWINAGCPERAGGPPHFPAPAGAAKAPAKDAPKGPLNDAPQDAPKPKTSALGFAEVMKLFKDLRQKAPNAPHSDFWKELSYQEFIAFDFPLRMGRPGEIRMLIPYDSGASNMLKAFKDGKGLLISYPDGTTKTIDIDPMPKDGDPLPPAAMKQLADWIDAGCPEFAGKPSTCPKPTSTPKKPVRGAEPPPPPPVKDKPADMPPPADGGGGFPEPASGGGG